MRLLIVDDEHLQLTRPQRESPSNLSCPQLLLLLLFILVLYVAQSLVSVISVGVLVCGAALLRLFEGFTRRVGEERARGCLAQSVLKQKTNRCCAANGAVSWMETGSGVWRGGGVEGVS